MILIEKLIINLRNSIVDLAKMIWKDYEDAAIYDGTSFLNNIKDDLEKWSLQLADQSLTQKDFDLLIREKKVLVKLKALSDQGLSEACLDKFADDLLNTIISGTKKSVA